MIPFLFWLLPGTALGSVPLDADAIVRAAWETDPLVSLIDAGVNAGMKVRARPEDLQFRPSFRELGSATSGIETTLRFRQPLEAPGSLRAVNREADAKNSARLFKAEIRRRELQALVLSTYDQIRFGEEERRLLDAEVDLAEQRVQVLRLRLEGGLPVAEEVMDAVIDRTNAISRRARLRVEIEAWRRSLESLSGINALRVKSGDLIAEVSEPLPEVALKPSVSPSESVAEAVLASRKAERRPFFDWIQGEMKLRPNERVSFGISANVEVPFWRYFDGEVAAARAALDVEIAARRARDAARSQAYADGKEHFRRSVEALKEASDAVDAARGVVAELGGLVSPDELLGIRVQLLQEERRRMGLVKITGEARRQAIDAMVVEGF